MKFITNRKFDKMINRLNDMETQAKKYDTLVDPLSSRGSAEDRTQRLRGSGVVTSNRKNMDDYISNGFLQNIIELPAEDATREWITIKATLDGEETEVDFAELIQNRMDDLKIQTLIEELIRYSRLNANGSFLYYAVKANAVQSEEQLKEPIPESIKTIEFINVVDDSDRVTISISNTSDPTKKDYNKPVFSMGGYEIHPSRLSWLVNSWIPSKNSGISVVQTVRDAIVAQDSGLWSSATLLGAMALNIFKSDEIADLSPEQKATLLAKIKHLMITYSAIALKSEEAFEQLSLQMTGMKEIFDYIFDNLAGLARIPKNILLGKAHGVVTAGEYDTLNYYANISRIQEIKLRPIIQKIIDMIVHEESGEIWEELGGNLEGFEVTFEYDSLWKLDPVADADRELKYSQRDQIDVTIGKTSPEELRSLDPRYKNLEPFEMDRTMPPNLTEPEPAQPEGPEVPEEEETSEGAAGPVDEDEEPEVPEENEVEEDDE